MLDEQVTLMVGMELASYSRFVGYKIVTIQSITPSGKWFLTSDGRKYDRTGHLVLDRSVSVCLVDDFIRRSIQIQKAYNVLSGIDWRRESPEILLEIEALYTLRKQQG